MIFRLISALVLTFSLFWYFYRYRKKETSQIADFSTRLISLGITIMAVTGFTHPLIFGEKMNGILLLLHVTTGALLAVFATSWIILHAGQNLFMEEDFSGDKYSLGSSGVLKALFWLLSVLALSVMTSILFSMIVETDVNTAEFLLQIHRYSALFLVILFIFYKTSR